MQLFVQHNGEIIMKKISLLTAFIFLFSAMPATADEINMKLELEGCDAIVPSYLEVEIWNPPGGYAQVTSDGSITLNVPTGTKLSATLVLTTEVCTALEPDCFKACGPDSFGTCTEHCLEQCEEENPIMSEWQEAEDGGVLQVQCF